VYYWGYQVDNNEKWIGPSIYYSKNVIGNNKGQKNGTGGGLL
jgi:hypothetical protein